METNKNPFPENLIGWSDIAKGVAVVAYESLRDFVLKRHISDPQPPTFTQQRANEWGAKLDMQDATPETAAEAIQRDLEDQALKGW